jgi:hypothetical protein
MYQQDVGLLLDVEDSPARRGFKARQLARLSAELQIDVVQCGVLTNNYHRSKQAHPKNAIQYYNLLITTRKQKPVYIQRHPTDPQTAVSYNLVRHALQLFQSAGLLSGGLEVRAKAGGEHVQGLPSVIHGAPLVGLGLPYLGESVVPIQHSAHLVTSLNHKRNALRDAQVRNAQSFVRDQLHKLSLGLQLERMVREAHSPKLGQLPATVVALGCERTWDGSVEAGKAGARESVYGLQILDPLVGLQEGIAVRDCDLLIRIRELKICGFQDAPRRPVYL